LRHNLLEKVIPVIIRIAINIANLVNDSLVLLYYLQEFLFQNQGISNGLAQSITGINLVFQFFQSLKLWKNFISSSKT